MNSKISSRFATLGAAAVLVLATGCGGQDEGDSSGDGESVSGEVVADGSSTVGPLTSAAGELFKEEQSGVNVSVATSGTGGGFEKFCQGDTDISNASRPIDDADEVPICEENGVDYVELQVANDALTVVVSAENDFVDCLTVDELNTMWAPESEGEITTWSQVNPDFPDEPLELFGAGTDSGTFQYFTEAVNGEEDASRSDYNATEDDNVTVQGVAGSEYALGYFGYTFYEQNADQLKAVAIDGGDGCVEPSPETSADGSYTPLSRPLFIYVSTTAYTDKPQVKAFIDYYVGNDAEIAEIAKFIPLSDDQRSSLEDAASTLSSGS